VIAPHLSYVKRIHLIGIGGAGMSGIAEVLLHQGYEVTGSDTGQNAMLQRLQSLKATIFHEHKAENVLGADVVVTSTIIAADNPEVVAAHEARIPVVPRAQMLADLMRVKQGIAIAGTHGKTTTTSLVTALLTEAGLDPTFVIGGLLKSAGAHARLGQSPFFVAEADESDASFLYLHPQIAIVTNIDADHLSTYNNDFGQLRATFVEFLHRLPFNGLAIVCIDDPNVRDIIGQIARPTITYGFDEEADVRISNFQPENFQTSFSLSSADIPTFNITLNLPGAHNVLNAAAACIVAIKLGVPLPIIRQAFRQFTGVGRRLQVYGELPIVGGQVLLVDDYGHHPREVSVTLTAVRQAWPGRRLVVVYQPHRYTRTHDLFNEFVEVLSQQVDQLILLDVYSAGEAPIAGADGLSLFEAICQHSNSEPVFVPNMSALPEVLQKVLRPGDVLLTQGAGSVGTIAPQLAANGLIVNYVKA
jgi:UDP-N-acetylmuramate--alanine ligase